MATLCIAWRAKLSSHSRQTGADLIGLGVASFSHIAGTHFQNITEFQQYLEAIQRGDLPISRAMATTEEERMIRELILQMKLGRVSRSYFSRNFTSIWRAGSARNGTICAGADC